MKGFILAVLALFAFNSYAAEQSAISKVTFVTVGTTYARIKLETMKAVESCPEQDFYILDFSIDPGNHMYSALLSAYATKTPTYLLLSGCYQNKPRITHVYLK